MFASDSVCPWKMMASATEASLRSVVVKQLKQVQLCSMKPEVPKPMPKSGQIQKVFQNKIVIVLLEQLTVSSMSWSWITNIDVIKAIKRANITRKQIKTRWFWIA